MSSGSSCFHWQADFQRDGRFGPSGFITRERSDAAAEYFGCLTLVEPELLAHFGDDVKIESSLAIDHTLGIAHSNLAVGYTLENDLQNAAREYELSFQLSPTQPRVIANLSRLLAQLGRSDEAVRAQRQLVLRDPASAQSQMNFFLFLLMAGQLEEAEAACRTGLLMTPDYAYAHSILPQVLMERGKFQESLKEAQLDADPGARLVQGPAEVYAFRGDADKAFAWLEIARLADDPEIGTAHISGALANLQKGPRWLPFLRKIGKAPEQLAKIKFNPRLPI